MHATLLQRVHPKIDENPIELAVEQQQPQGHSREHRTGSNNSRDPAISQRELSLEQGTLNLEQIIIKSTWS